jgi:hypothetical protein
LGCLKIILTKRSPPPFDNIIQVGKITGKRSCIICLKGYDYLYAVGLTHKTKSEGGYIMSKKIEKKVVKAKQKASPEKKPVTGATVKTTTSGQR